MKKTISLILALILALSLVSCAGKKAAVTDYGQTALTVAFLKGPTGVGAAYLMEQCEQGVKGGYDITLEEAPSAVAAAFIQGSLGAAAVPTNVAAMLYNKLEGNVRLIAVNTLSVLHILEAGDTVHSVADLRGRTVYATGQGANPEYVLNYILRENGLEPGTDVTVEFMDSGELVTRMVSGDVDLCMLPVPAATTVLMKNPDVRDALSLGDEWARTDAGSELAQAVSFSMPTWRILTCGSRCF
jgi:NitT/TauT family transport system substrate-binding protein